MSKYYYVYKRGVYGHGVHWVGESASEGESVCRKLALDDIDDYHQWQLFLYRDNEDVLIFETNKSVEE